MTRACKVPLYFGSTLWSILVSFPFIKTFFLTDIFKKIFARYFNYCSTMIHFFKFIFKQSCLFSFTRHLYCKNEILFHFKTTKISLKEFKLLWIHSDFAFYCRQLAIYLQPTIVYIAIPNSRRGAGVDGSCPPPPQLFLKLNFARYVFLQIRFCVILQGIQNLCSPGTPRIWLGALTTLVYWPDWNLKAHCQVCHNFCHLKAL